MAVAPECLSAFCTASCAIRYRWLRTLSSMFSGASCWATESHRRAAQGAALGERLQSGVQIAVGIRQRGQALHDQARILNAAGRERGELIEIVRDRIALAGGAIGERAGREREAGELLAEAIVHFLADAPLLARQWRRSMRARRRADA